MLLALKPVRETTQEEELSPPAITRKAESSNPGLTYQFPKLNTQMDDIIEINSQEIAAQKQSLTRVKIETFQYEGKTYLAIQQQGVLIVREDS